MCSFFGPSQNGDKRGAGGDVRRTIARRDGTSASQLGYAS